MAASDFISSSSEEGLAYVVNSRDNVATALAALPAGSRVCLTGETALDSILVTEDIPRGFKLALYPLPANTLILKYGIPIGRTTVGIEPGTCVHLHNMISLADFRIQHFNVHDATPEDRRYDLQEET